MLSTEEIRAIRPIQNELNIRKPEAGDAQALLAYLQHLAQEVPNNTGARRDVLHRTVEEQRKRLCDYLARPNSCLFIAEVGERIVGLIKCAGQQEPMVAHTVEISISVHPHFRGMGIGSALLQHAITWASQQHHIVRVQLEVLTRNENALRLYERIGFVREGIRRKSYYFFDEEEAGAYHDAWVMGLLLDEREGG